MGSIVLFRIPSDVHVYKSQDTPSGVYLICTMTDLNETIKLLKYSLITMCVVLGCIYIVHLKIMLALTGMCASHVSVNHTLFQFL